MPYDFSGMHIVVCGGSSGVGLAAAKAFAGAGAEVTATGRSRDRLEAALAGAGSVRAVSVDGSDEAKVLSFFNGLDRLDHLVVSIGGGAAAGNFANIDGAAWQGAFDGKLLPYLYAARAGASRIADSGSITLVTGAAASRPAVGGSGRAVVNAALNALVGPLSLELAPARINAVAPGLLATPYWDAFMDADQQRAMYDRAAGRLPVGRVGTADDIAEAILFLAGNGFTTGTVVTCDGGPPMAA